MVTITHREVTTQRPAVIPASMCSGTPVTLPLKDKREIPPKKTTSFNPGRACSAAGKGMNYFAKASEEEGLISKDSAKKIKITGNILESIGHAWSYYKGEC